MKAYNEFLLKGKTSEEAKIEAAKLLNDDNNPYKKTIKLLENKLDKAMIKYNEALTVKRTYSEILNNTYEEKNNPSYLSYIESENQYLNSDKFNDLHRKEYQKFCEQVDKSCRCHGGCEYCLGNRMYQKKKMNLEQIKKHFNLGQSSANDKENKKHKM